VLIAGVSTAVLGIWWAVDLFHRPPAIPSREYDKGSLLALNVAHAFQLVGVLVGFLGVGRIDGVNVLLQLCGLGLLVAGIAVRWTAIHALGVFFTGRVQIREGHTLMRTGLYSRLRHPGYAGALLAYVGLGLAFSNWWTLACSVLPYLVAIGYRIRVEEAVLQETFGPAYAQYARATKRIVPWVY
jgi:protein-S-isoprenylcysteine O-methyltransferase Ste14